MKVPSSTSLVFALLAGTAIGVLGTVILTALMGASAEKPKNKAGLPKIWTDSELELIIQEALGFDDVEVIRWENGDIRGYCKLLDEKTFKEVEYKLDLLPPEKGFPESKGWLVICKRLVGADDQSSTVKKYDVIVASSAEWIGEEPVEETTTKSGGETSDRKGWRIHAKHAGQLIEDFGSDPIGYKYRAPLVIGYPNTKEGAELLSKFPESKNGYWFFLELMPQSSK